MKTGKVEGCWVLTLRMSLPRTDLVTVAITIRTVARAIGATTIGATTIAQVGTETVDRLTTQMSTT